MQGTAGRHGGSALVSVLQHRCPVFSGDEFGDPLRYVIGCCVRLRLRCDGHGEHGPLPGLDIPVAFGYHGCRQIVQSLSQVVTGIGNQQLLASAGGEASRAGQQTHANGLNHRQFGCIQFDYLGGRRGDLRLNFERSTRSSIQQQAWYFPSGEQTRRSSGAEPRTGRQDLSTR